MKISDGAQNKFNLLKKFRIYISHKLSQSHSKKKFPHLMMVEKQRKKLRAEGYELDWLRSDSLDGFDLHGNSVYRNFN